MDNLMRESHEEHIETFRRMLSLGWWGAAYAALVEMREAIQDNSGSGDEATAEAVIAADDILEEMTALWNAATDSNGNRVALLVPTPDDRRQAMLSMCASIGDMERALAVAGCVERSELTEEVRVEGEAVAASIRRDIAAAEQLLRETIGNLFHSGDIDEMPSETLQGALAAAERVEAAMADDTEAT